MNNTAAASIVARMFARDLDASIALADERKRENAERRANLRVNRELGAALLVAANRRGESCVDWEAYFRNAGI